MIALRQSAKRCDQWYVEWVINNERTWIIALRLQDECRSSFGPKDKLFNRYKDDARWFPVEASDVQAKCSLEDGKHTRCTLNFNAGTHSKSSAFQI